MMCGEGGVRVEGPPRDEGSLPEINLMRYSSLLYFRCFFFLCFALLLLVSSPPIHHTPPPRCLFSASYRLSPCLLPPLRRTHVCVCGVSYSSFMLDKSRESE